ncbi:MAG: T9SS type A sorting domain-containing protein [Bacteroidota bacterium]
MKKLCFKFFLCCFLSQATLSNILGQDHLTIADGHFRISGEVNLVLINASLINNASLEATAGTVIFKGDAASPLVQIGGSSESQFHNLVIERPNNVNLGNNVSISGLLDLRTGLLVLEDFNADLGTTGTMQSTAQTYVETSGTGTIMREVPSGSSFEYILGRGSRTPISIQNDGATDVFSVRVTDEVLTEGSSGSPFGSEVVDRTWIITEATDGGSDLTLTAQWNASDELPAFDRTNAYIAQYLGDWDLAPPSAATGTDPYQLSRSGITSLSEFTVTSSAALPVELLSFTAEPSGGQVLLRWQTTNEINNDYFVVERSQDALEFREIDRLDGAGTYEGLSNYQTVDETPFSGMNYYRLRQVDFDGSYAFSEIRAVRFDILAKEIAVFPNPTSGRVSIQLEQADPELTVELIDPQGRVVAAEQFGASNLQSFDTSGLTKGVYLLRVSGTTGVERVVRLLVQ